MEKKIILGLIIAVAVLLLIVLVLAIKNKGLRFGGVKVKKGVRYTKDERIEKDTEANITYNKKDIVVTVIAVLFILRFAFINTL